MKKYKIIDCIVKGNLITLCLANPDIKDWYGDDWNDPLDNSGPVYDEFVERTFDLVVPSNYLVEELENNYSYNSGISKDKMKNGGVPMLSIVKKDGYSFGDFFDGVDYIFMGTTISLKDDAKLGLWCPEGSFISHNPKFCEIIDKFKKTYRF